MDKMIVKDKKEGLLQGFYKEQRKPKVKKEEVYDFIELKHQICVFDMEKLNNMLKYHNTGWKDYETIKNKQVKNLKPKFYIILTLNIAEKKTFPDSDSDSDNDLSDVIFDEDELKDRNEANLQDIRDELEFKLDEIKQMWA